jgi:hypothetical protein
MSEHTPGPWTVHVDGQSVMAVEGAGVRLIAECHAGQREEREGNAKLIAAAPETKRQRDALLKACRQTLAWFESFDGDGHTHGDGVPSAWLRSTIALCEKEGV